MIIYITRNKINHKFYIGKDSKNNPDYYGSGILIILAIKKYPRLSNNLKNLNGCKFIQTKENLTNEQTNNK